MCAKLASTLKMKSPLHFTAMCPGCFKLFEVDIPKARIDFEYEQGSIYDTITTDSIRMTHPNMYCEMLNMKHTCGSEENLVQIDSLIAPAVQKFNKLGFKTAYCCAGHVYPDKAPDMPYILFDIPENVQNIEAYLKPLRKAIKLDEGGADALWNWDAATGKLLDGIICEFDQDVEGHRLMMRVDPDHFKPETLSNPINMSCRLDTFVLNFGCVANRLENMLKEETKNEN